MSITHKTLIGMLATMIGLAMGTCAMADSTFRGILRDQGNNLLYRDSLNRMGDLQKPFYMDITESFSRDGRLISTANGQRIGTEVDGLQIGFVPPADGVPYGPLQGADADAHGRWVSFSDDYVTSSANNGSVHRLTGTGTAVAAMPWRVAPGLGDYYHIEMTAVVATGETVSLGYLGDINTAGAQGLDGELGQLVLGLERGTGVDQDEVRWTVAWDLGQGGQRVAVSNTTSVPMGEEINLQLGWLDQGNDDLLDAWLGTSTSNTRLFESNMGVGIDVYAVGFEMNGTGSTIGSFTSAVPEPATGLMVVLGMIGFVGLRRR